MDTASPSITAYLTGLSAARLRALFSQEPERAADWVRVIALEGLRQAQVCYGRMLLEGTGGLKDLPAALAWFRRAAARGDMDAVNMVGRCFDNGWGTAGGPGGGGGHFRGQYNWASVLLNTGRAVEAAGWFERAVAGGSETMRRAVMETLVRAGVGGEAEGVA